MNVVEKREIIYKNIKNSEFRGLLNKGDYILVEENIDSCMDTIFLEVKIEDSKVEDIHFDGKACSIALASTSILCQTVINKSLDEVNVILENYSNMLNGEDYKESILNDLVVFRDIYRQENRVKCASMGMYGLLKAIKIYHENKSN